MPNYKDKLSADGGINKDVSVEQLPAGDYPDALDISFLGDGVSASKSQTPKLGNKFAADRGSVSAQNKKYRLYIDLTASGTLSYTVTFYKTDTTTALFSATFTNGSLTVADNAISNAAAAAGYGINIVNNGVYLLIEFAPMSGGVPTNYYDYYINDTGTDALEDLYVYQEAIDLTLVGENRAIGSYDLLGDLFIWSTSQTELPSDLEAVIYSITHTTVLTNITIDFTSAHGLNTGERILVQGVEVLTGANGYWIVIATSTTQIQLAMSETVPQLGQIFTGTGSITINPSGIGEIGVSQKVQSTQNWTYTRLLRSKEWNWNTKKQFDTYCEQTATNRNLYGTNDYTPPMVFYYQTAYSTDGALTFNGGLYDYGTVFDETRLFLSVLNTQIEFTEQLQGGGALTAGNKRYAVRALTETATATDWSDVTNPVNVYAASNAANPEKIIGDISGTPTAKVNVLTISNIQSDIFKYVEVACIEYLGLSVSGYIVNRYIVNSSSMVIHHTGNETTSQLDINEIQTFSIPIDTAKNIRAIDNRMILSNLTTVSDEDLSSVATAITHSVVRTTITSVGNTAVSGIVYGEYQDPENVNNKMGYMINEVYRFSIKFRNRITGGWTKNYWVDDIIINSSSTNTANPFNDNRRIAGLPDLMLTNTVNSGGFNIATLVNVPYLEFSNVDFNYITQTGLRLGDIYDQISFERAECVPEILFTGMARMGVIQSSLASQPHTPRPPMGVMASDTSTFIYFDYDLLPTIVTNPSVLRFNYGLRRKFMAIYSPDIALGAEPYSFLAGDNILNYGNPLKTYEDTTSGTPFTAYVEWIGDFSPSPTGYLPTTHPVDAGQTVVWGGEIVLNTVPFYNREYQLADSADTFSAAVNTQTDLQNNSTYRDFGYYYVQYQRPQNDKYGDIPQTQYITCGNSYSTASQTVASVFEVFGGDTFTQRTFMKATTNEGNQGAGFANDGIGFYSQNRVNSQMRQASGLTTEKVFPVDTSGATYGVKISDWLTSGTAAELLAYDLSYNIINGVDYHSAYDPDLIDNNDQPTRIRWSPVKPQNAIADLYRVFLPFDFHDLDNSFGEITHHENVNGELFTLQPKKWQRQFFNTRGVLDVRGISDVLIGDGSVMSRDGITISNFGCSNKWSVIKGRSAGGNDTIYWIDIINKQAIRFGADGTVGISTIKGLLSFLSNDLEWCVPNDQPADGLGMHGWWHERFKEAIFVVRARRGVKSRLTSDDEITTPQDYSLTTTYSFGSVVFYEGYGNDFNQEQVFFRSLFNNNVGNLPTNTGWWEQIEITDSDYYNMYSLCFSEIKNRFTSFYSPLPKIAMQWNNSYLTPRPISVQSRDYEANRGEYCTWYVQGSSELATEGYISMIYNKDYDMSKMFIACLVSCSVIPYKIVFKTSQHETVSIVTDFKQYMNEYATAIKNDLLTVHPTGASKLWGTYIIVEFYFENKQFNSLNNAVIKFNTINPMYQK